MTKINNTNITTAIVLDKRRAKEEDKYPVKLRVTYDRDYRYYNTNHALTKDEFEKAISPRPRGDYKELRLKFNLIEEKAQDVIDKIDDFSFDKFKNFYSRKPKDLRNVYFYYEKQIKELDKKGKIGTASWYSTSVNSIKKFSKKSSYLEFKSITSKFLKDYEHWMLDIDNSISSVSINLRALRAIFNHAKKDSIITNEQYPFGKDKYQIPESKNIKKSLKIDDIAKLYNYEVPEFSYQDKAKDFWFFSYLFNGANMADIANLKYKNINTDTITFIRLKTAGIKKEKKPIVSPLTDYLKQIIEKWGNKNQSPDNYVFPILEEGLTPKQKKGKIKWLVKQVNKHMRTISEDAGIKEKVTTYTARHSFSTVLKRSGASTEFISESLGHSDLKTTENYLDSFENDVKKQYASKLLDFKNNKTENT